MRAMVTGGMGFVGLHLVADLREAGDDVTVLDRHGIGRWTSPTVRRSPP